MPIKQLYYMQDKRQYVGNSMYWWAKDGKGYTCDIRKAQIFTLDEAKEHTNRGTDILWPKEYIDDRISHHIDMQHCDRGTCNTISMDLTKNRSGEKNKQKQAEAVLERNGYKWKHSSDEFGFIVLAKRLSLGMIQQVEIDEDGLCNGLPLDDYLKEVVS
jgi:hypothetical protein